MSTLACGWQIMLRACKGTSWHLAQSHRAHSGLSPSLHQHRVLSVSSCGLLGMLRSVCLGCSMMLCTDMHRTQRHEGAWTAQC